MDNSSGKWWKDFYPKWLLDFSSWFGGFSVKTIFGSSLVATTVMLFLIFFNQDELLMGEIILRGLGILVLTLYIFITGFVSFITANIKLDTEKSEKILELTVKEENKLNVATAPSFEKEVVVGRKKIKHLTLEIYNENTSKKIVEFGVKVGLSFFHINEEQGIKSGISTGGNLLWLKEKSIFIELRPSDKSEVVIAVVEDNLLRSMNFIQSKEEEVVIQLMLQLTGKYEGENNFRNYPELRSIYYTPQYGKVVFTNFVPAMFPDINPELRKIINFVNNGGMYKENF